MLPTDVPFPEALSPEYACGVNEPIPLYHGEGVLSTKGREHRGQCSIQYSWHPYQGLEVVFSSLSPPTPGFNGEYTLEVPAIGLKAPVLCRRSTFGTHGSSFTGLFSGKVRTGQETGLVRISFHIANFPFVRGSTIRRGNNQMWARIHLEDASWVIDIDPVPDEHEPGDLDLPGRIKESNGYAITHVGSITRADGGTFNVTDADEVLRDVFRTLSFARAASSNPFLRSGYNSSGAKVWQCWSGGRIDAWHTRNNWFSEVHPQSLQSVFAGWRTLANTSDLEVVSAAMQLYNESHTPNLTVESKLVLAQAALEGLADGWPHPPMPGSPVLPKFESGAAERIAKISRSLGLPLNVPAALSALAKLAKPKEDAPALDKMTWVRNSIAHLGKFPRLAGESSQAKYEALQLAVWHLELALLRLLDARGPYHNRLTVKNRGEVDPLPWIPKAP